jgi:hypothetical protein
MKRRKRSADKTAEDSSSSGKRLNFPFSALFKKEDEMISVLASESYWDDVSFSGNPEAPAVTSEPTSALFDTVEEGMARDCFEELKLEPSTDYDTCTLEDVLDGNATLESVAASAPNVVNAYSFIATKGGVRFSVQQVKHALERAWSFGRFDNIPMLISLYVENRSQQMVAESNAAELRELIVRINLDQRSQHLTCDLVSLCRSQKFTPAHVIKAVDPMRDVYRSFPFKAIRTGNLLKLSSPELAAAHYKLLLGIQCGVDPLELIDSTDDDHLALARRLSLFSSYLTCLAAESISAPEVTSAVRKLKSRIPKSISSAAALSVHDALAKITAFIVAIT